MYVVWYYWLLLDVIDWHWLINGWFMYGIVKTICMAIIGCPWLLWLLRVWLLHLGWSILHDVLRLSIMIIVLCLMNLGWCILIVNFINVFELMYVGWCILIDVLWSFSSAWWILVDVFWLCIVIYIFWLMYSIWFMLVDVFWFVYYDNGIFLDES